MSLNELITTTENTEFTEKNQLNALTHNIIGAAIEVHKILGPGLLESAYVACLIFELKLRQIKIQHQKPRKWSLPLCKKI